MFKSRKIIIITVLAAVVVLSMGIIGGSVYASSNTSADDAAKPQNTLMERVASKLGIDISTLEDAFKEAQEEVKAEALDNRLQKLVEDGNITEEQAAEYKEWLESKPDIDVSGLADGKRPAGQGGMMRHGMGPNGIRPHEGKTGGESSGGE
ncbi:MAG: hypothetical protein JXA46_12775 [Dehalococcoidales bacterium]|nr:hypothetical protein [Dehalococcoidales bacterium]